MIFLKLHRGRGFTPIVPVNGGMLDTQQIYYRDGTGEVDPGFGASGVVGGLAVPS